MQKENSHSSSKRILWIDFAKFIGMLLVILGHRGKIRLLNMFIFSFHVPVFFVLSGMTFSFSKNLPDLGKKTLKRFLRLIIPYLISLIVFTIIDIIMKPEIFSLGSYWLDQLLKVVGYSSANYLYIDALWFLFALFVSGTMFDLLHLFFKNIKDLFVCCCALSLIGVFLGILLNKTPLMLDVSMSVLPFLCFGYFLKNYDFSRKNWLISLLLLLIWGSLMIIMWFSKDGGTYMAISNRRYTLFPLCYICAIAGSFLYLKFCFCVCKWFPKFIKPFAFLGRYTLYMVCVHSLGRLYYHQWFKISENIHVTNIVYFGLGTLIFLIILACDLLVHKIREKHKQNFV